MSNNKFKVLIIEDEANICSFIQTLLETNGYQALVAQTCMMGMTMFISYNPDLVILEFIIAHPLFPPYPLLPFPARTGWSCPHRAYSQL